MVEIFKRCSVKKRGFCQKYRPGQPLKAINSLPTDEILDVQIDQLVTA